MQQYYSGYHFIGANHALFNPTQCIFFLSEYATNRRFKNGVLSNNLQSFQLLDENVRMGKSVLHVLGSLKEAKLILMQLFSTGITRVQSHIRPAMNYRNIASPVHRTETTYHESWDVTLSFMYYHGMIAFSQQSLKNSSPREVVIPNAICSEQLLPLVRKIAQTYESEMVTFLTTPTETNLQGIIWSILGSVELQNEEELQSVVESAFALFCNSLQSPFSIKVEESSDKAKRSNVIVSTKKDICIIEFKQVKIADLKEYQFTIILNPFEYQLWCSQFKLRTENELLQLELTFQHANNFTVSDHVNQAIEQVMIHGNLEKENNPNKTIHKFVVVQVFHPIIVKKVQ